MENEMQTYSDPTREHDPHALPDVEVFEMRAADFETAAPGSMWHDKMIEDIPGWSYLSVTDRAKILAGWYWWPCFPGCMPDSDPVGPFATEQEAIADAQGEG